MESLQALLLLVAGRFFAETLIAVLLMAGALDEE